MVMNKHLVSFFLILAMVNVCFAKYVAVLETVADQKDLLTLSERQYLTNVLREEAVKALPAEMNYTIMTRENISVMLPPGKSIEDCEGSCLAETGKNISADYVAQARVGKVGASLSISAEIYETAGNKLVASFNGRGADVEALIVVISEKSPAFFKKARGANDGFGGASGIGDFNSAGGFSVTGKNSFLVDVVTTPAGAALSIDGRPVPKCVSTPCKIPVEEGEHRFVAVKDRYLDAEKVMRIDANGTQVKLDLDMNFGYLEVNPSIVKIGSPRDLQITVDGKSVSAGNIELELGTHQVRVTHPCYDPLEFKVGISKGKTEKFDSELNRGQAGLKLNAEWNGEAQIVPVWVDGKKVGETPFLGEIPMCAEVAVGESGNIEMVPVNLKWHETVEVDYNMLNVGTKALLGKTANSVPTNIDQNQNGAEKKGGVHWIPVGISAAVAVAGAVLAVVGNSSAKDAYDRGFDSKDEYKKNKDDAHNGQTLRTIGIVTAIVGAVGVGVSFLF